MGWSQRGARGGLALDRPVDLSADSSLDLRVIVDPRRGPVRLAVRVEDADGNADVLLPRRKGLLEAFPGKDPLGKLWGQTLRAKLGQASGVDLTRVSRVLLVARSDAGRVWMLDAAGHRPGLARLPDARVPRVDVGDVRVVEGSDGSEGVIDVPLTFDTTLTRRAVLTVLTVELSAAEARTLRLVVPAGRDSAVVQIPYERDTVDDADVTEHVVRIHARRGVMTSDYLGFVRIIDDDPVPVASFEPVSDEVTEGAALQWQVTLDRPADYGIGFELRPIPVGEQAAALRTADLPRTFLRRRGLDPAAPSRPLADSELTLPVELPAGTTTARLQLPTRVDSRQEPPESVRFRVEPNPTLPGRVALTGIVTD
jgi:hypothetical protein